MDPIPPAGSQRLKGRFLGGKTRGIPLAFVLELFTISNFGGSIDALGEPFAVPLEDLFELIDNEDLSGWLSQRRQELHLLFEAIKGSEEATGQLKRRRPTLGRLASEPTVVSTTPSL